MHILSHNLTTSIQTYEPVSPPQIELQLGVAKQLDTVEGHGEVVNVDIPRCRVGRKYT